MSDNLNGLPPFRPSRYQSPICGVPFLAIAVAIDDPSALARLLKSPHTRFPNRIPVSAFPSTASSLSLPRRLPDAKPTPPPSQTLDTHAGNLPTPRRHVPMLKTPSLSTITQSVDEFMALTGKVKQPSSGTLASVQTEIATACRDDNELRSAVEPIISWSMNSHHVAYTFTSLLAVVASVSPLFVSAVVIRVLSKLVPNSSFVWVAADVESARAAHAFHCSAYAGADVRTPLIMLEDSGDNLPEMGFVAFASSRTLRLARLAKFKSVLCRIW